MMPLQLLLEDPSPRRALVTSRAELHEGLAVAVTVARRTLRVMHRDLSVFDLSSVAATESLSRLLLADRSARVRMLVDDPTWLDARAARLRLLQRQFPHALELRVASVDDPVGDEACVLADHHCALVLQPAPTTRGDLWLHNEPHAQPLVAGFDRRWEHGVHNLPVFPLGLG